MTRTKEEGLRVYRKLAYYYGNKIPVHFKIKTGEFRNGIILDLNEEKLTLVLKEFVLGEMPFLLEDINAETITKYNNRVDNGD